MIFRVTDIETIPDMRFWSSNDPVCKIVSGPSLLGEGIRMPAVQEVAPFPPPQACRVVALSYVDVNFSPDHDPPYWYGGCHTECQWSGDVSAADEFEKSLLARFGRGVDEGVALHLVTWNGRTFDLPVIVMRSMLHGLACRWYYQNSNVRYRYSPEGHLDLMDHLGDYGASRQMRLGDCARLVGLPGKTDMSGDKVDVLYARSVQEPSLSDGYRDKVARYCLQDSLQTAVLFIRSRHLMGKLTTSTYNKIVRSFSENEDVQKMLDVAWDRVMVLPEDR